MYVCTWVYTLTPQLPYVRMYVCMCTCEYVHTYVRHVCIYSVSHLIYVRTYVHATIDEGKYVWPGTSFVEISILSSIYVHTYVRTHLYHTNEHVSEVGGQFSYISVFSDYYGVMQ